jgi:hypothetical protein
VGSRVLELESEALPQSGLVLLIRRAVTLGNKMTLMILALGIADRRSQKRSFSGERLH